MFPSLTCRCCIMYLKLFPVAHRQFLLCFQQLSQQPGTCLCLLQPFGLSFFLCSGLGKPLLMFFFVFPFVPFSALSLLIFFLAAGSLECNCLRWQILMQWEPENLIQMVKVYVLLFVLFEEGQFPHSRYSHSLQCKLLVLFVSLVLPLLPLLTLTFRWLVGQYSPVQFCSC